MTSKERMLIALHRGAPDRLPITIHQWQRYHLNTFMGGADQVAAFAAVGLDAAVAPGDVLKPRTSSDWLVTTQDLGEQAEGRVTLTRIVTPGGELTMRQARSQYTTFVTEHPVKCQADAELFVRYWPGQVIDKERLTWWYDRTGDNGIVRGFVQTFFQPGVWQELCELAGTEQAILWAMDDPRFVHDFLRELAARKVRYIHEQMPGAKFDLIEHGGGAASCTVISPSMFDEFCVPYDRPVIDALHELGFLVTYHTCGGMSKILDRIPANGCDASETLSPPGVGGDIATAADRGNVKRVLGSKVALIGGIDQGRLEQVSPEQVAADVRACFESFGPGGGYICSASDHFFTAPVENLKAMALAARECRY